MSTATDKTVRDNMCPLPMIWKTTCYWMTGQALGCSRRGPFELIRANPKRQKIIELCELEEAPSAHDSRRLNRMDVARNAQRSLVADRFNPRFQFIHGACHDACQVRCEPQTTNP